MAFKKIVRERAFWKSVIYLGLIFAIIYQFISMLIDYGGLDFSSFYEDRLAGTRWIRFVIGTLVAAFVYGFIISYGQFRSRIKRERREKNTEE